MANVKWGEFKLGKLFEILSYKKRFDANKVKLVENCGHPYIVRTSCNNGQKGFIDENEEFLNDGNTISFGQDTATMYYQEIPYFTGDKIKILKPRLPQFNKKNAQFFLATMRRTFQNFSWGNSSFNIDIISNQIIQLPLKSNAEELENPCEQIDFDFMESFISELENKRIGELEEERISELNAYLQATGLEDYTLTADEQHTLNESKNWNWGEFKLSKLFEITNTLSFNADKLVKGYGYDYVTRTSLNQGISQTTGFVNAENLNEANVWSLGLLQMDFFYRKKPWYAGQFVRKIIPKIKLHERAILFFSTILNQQKKNLLAVLVRNVDEAFRNLTIQLPLKSNVEEFATPLEKIDFESMELFIRAVEKLIIKDVVLYANKKIETTKKVIYDPYKKSEAVKNEVRYPYKVSMVAERQMPFRT